jgi:2-polyprenyl-6-methoxyphenol hydroxylase-like FAD-dependent oxidoreductase
MIFIDRQMLVQILYDNIRHKNRILTKSRVTRIGLIKNGIKAYTKEGKCFTGDIVVGADGIHSVVREEMWRIGMKCSPGYFPDNETSRE